MSNFGSRSLIYQPGGVQSGDTFNNWADLVEACFALFTTKIINFDSTFQSPILVPAKPGGGVWDFGSDTEFYGEQQFRTPTPILFQDQAKIAGVYQFTNLGMTSESSDHVIANLVAANVMFRINGTTTLTTTGTAPFFSQDVLANAFFQVNDLAEIRTGTVPVLTIGINGATLTIAAFDNCVVERDTLSTTLAFPGSAIYANRTSSCAFSLDQPNLSAPFIVTNTELSEFTEYDDAAVAPSVFGNTVQSALDYLKTHSPGVTGPANALGYFNPGGTALTGDALLTAYPPDQFGRPQIRDIRVNLGNGPVYRSGAWQVDGDPTNLISQGVVLYGAAPNGLQDGSNGTIGRIKPDRFATRLIYAGLDLGYAMRMDLAALPTAYDPTVPTPAGTAVSFGGTSFTATAPGPVPAYTFPNQSLYPDPNWTQSDEAAGFYLKNNAGLKTAWIPRDPTTADYALQGTFFLGDRFLVGINTPFYNAASGMQYASTTSGRASLRLMQYGANAGIPNLSFFKSRSATVDLQDPAHSAWGLNAGCIAGDVLARLTASGVAPNNVSVPLAGFVSIQVPSTFVPAGQNYLPSEFELQLVALGINTRRPVFKVSSEGIAETLSGVRAGGPNTSSANLDTGTLWSSGTAAPNGAIVGSVGDLYSQSTGTPGDVLWIKESGAATNTGWNAAQTSGSPPLGGILYVNLNAPAGGNGSVLAPFNTIQAAINAVPGVPSRINRWVIYLGPGVYTETSVTLRPWVFLVGPDAFSVRLGAYAPAPPMVFTMPAAWWNPASIDPNVTDTRSGFQGVTIAQSQTFDFNVGPTIGSAFAGSNEGKIYFTDTITNGLVSVIAFSTVNQVQSRHSQHFGGFSQLGTQVQFEASAVTGGADITIADVSGIPAKFAAFGGATNGNFIASSVSGDALNPGAIAVMQGFAVTGSLSLSGTWTAYQSTPEGIPKNVTIGGGASLPATLNGATALGYDDALVPPALPNNPNNVQSAIDALKVEVDSLATSGLRRTMKFSVGAATTASANNLPAGAFVLSAWLNVTTPDAAATVSLGQPLPGNITAFQSAGDNNPAVAGLYTGSPQVTAVGPGALPVLATVVGGTTLVADVIVDFSIPIN